MENIVFTSDSCGQGSQARQKVCTDKVSRDRIAPSLDDVCYFQEHWMLHGGQQSRAFQIIDTIYSDRYVLVYVRAHVSGRLKYRRIIHGYEFVCSRKVPLVNLADLSRDLIAVVQTCSIKHGFWHKL